MKLDIEMDTSIHAAIMCAVKEELGDDATIQIHGTRERITVDFSGPDGNEPSEAQGNAIIARIEALMISRGIVATVEEIDQS